MSDFPEGSSQKKGKGRKKNEGTRKRASAIDLSVDPLPPLAVQQTHPDLYAGTSGPSVHFVDSLPQPIGPFETHSEPFMNLGLDVESKDVPQYPEMVVAHRRCSSDTFYTLLQHLAVPDIDMLGGSSRGRRPTVDNIQQDDILGFLDDGSQKGPPSPSPLVSPAVRSELSFSRSTSLPSGPEGASSSASRRVKQEEPESSTGGAKSFQNALKRKRRKSSDDHDMASGIGRNRALSLVDEKKAKRILANRISAQKSRMRKLNFIGGLEKNVAALQNQIEVLKPQLEKAVQQNCDLKKINNELKKQRESLLNS